MGVPKKIFLEYARENEDKKLAEQMIKENRYGTTVFKYSSAVTIFFDHLLS